MSIICKNAKLALKSRAILQLKMSIICKNAKLDVKNILSLKIEKPETIHPRSH
jgi:hypothetical protein